MTYKEFIEKLSETKDKYDWAVTHEGYIRGVARPGLVVCPISAVMGAEACMPLLLLAAEGELGLSADYVLEVMNASDSAGGFEIREALLEAIGLGRAWRPSPTPSEHPVGATTIAARAPEPLS
jgi:hypothetical protein